LRRKCDVAITLQMVYTYGGGVDAAEVTAGELPVTARRIITADLITVVTAVIVMVTPPLRRNAATIRTDERRRRTRPLSTETHVLVRPAETNNCP